MIWNIHAVEKKPFGFECLVLVVPVGNNLSFSPTHGLRFRRDVKLESSGTIAGGVNEQIDLSLQISCVTIRRPRVKSSFHKIPNPAFAMELS